MTHRSDCIFCRISCGDISADILFQDASHFVIRDLNPQAPVHLLIIPRQHVLQLSTDEEATAKLLGEMVSLATDMARKESVAETGYRIVVNQGRNAGQTVEHLHMHLLGGTTLAALA
ncbi:HIT domain-containing protein [SAR202 cluster bacterium AD-804-J14_MRT_500m]|nr:HIT domain-containing protein [SAR202 cluster bacterium AD-804-J14_MRT_500m]